MNPLRQIATALTFLTRLPLVARFAYPDAAAIAKSAWSWPWIGAGLGWCAAQVFLFAAAHFSPWIAALLATASTVLLTGAFHEDGVADSADGLYGGFTVERRLEIMKDSRIGSYGALALILLIALKVACLVAIPMQDLLIACVLSHALARASSLPLTFFLPYARGDGNNKPIGTEMPWWVVLLGLASALAMLYLGSSHWWLIAGLAAVFWLLAAWYLKSKIAGFTGDTLGAVNQLTEVGVLLFFCAR